MEGEYNRNNTIFLFDVDGTLTESRAKSSEKIINMLKTLKTKVKIAFVGGSDIDKQIEQIGNNCLEIFDYGFPENGLSFYKNGNLIKQEKIIDFMKEDFYKEFVNFSLKYLLELDLPIKRGTFIEYRNSMINISPIGRNCSREERNDFFELDKKEKFRENMVTELKKRFGNRKMSFVIGGQISTDCFPEGWDKRYCLKHIKEEKIKNIFFFGDMTHPGGNDYEIYEHEDVKGFKVDEPDTTIEKVNSLLSELGI